MKLPVILMVLCFLIGSLVGVIVMRTCLQSVLPEQPRVIHTVILDRYNDMELLLQDFQEDLISIDEVIQILLLWHKENETILLTLFETDTYADKYLVHKKTYLQNHKNVKKFKNRE